MKVKMKSCIECGTAFNVECSKMKELCPDCAHKHYGYKSCENIYEDNNCTVCFWEGSKSKA